jgi:hypothetical protein
MNNILIELKEKYRETYKIKKLLCFKSTKDPELAILIQLISDLEKAKKTFLSEDIKFININFRIIDRMILVFIVLAE